jgi:hypothetical protein
MAALLLDRWQCLCSIDGRAFGLNQWQHWCLIDGMIILCSYPIYSSMYAEQHGICYLPHRL